MKIDKKDQYHGAALTQIVEHASFKALNKASDKYGHYQVNHDCRLHVKHTGANGGSWRFTFQAGDVAAIAEDATSYDCVLVCVVCGSETVCVLSQEEVAQVVDLGSQKPQWLCVESPPGCSMRVRGSAGELPHTVAHSAFPKSIFARS